MFSFKKEKEKSRAEIAKMMSEVAQCEISERKINADIRTASFTLYSVKIRDNPRDSMSGLRIIYCAVRRFKTPIEYEITVQRIS